MHRAIQTFTAFVWGFYGLGSLTHTTTFWAGLIGLEMPHLSFAAVDLTYYAIAAVVCPHYFTKAWEQFRKADQPAVRRPSRRSRDRRR